MNEPNDFEDVERMLREMSLKAPSPGLDRRVEKAVRAPGRLTLWLSVAGGMAAGVAIAFAGLRAWPTNEPPAPIAPHVAETHGVREPVEPVRGGSRLPEGAARAEPVCLQRVYNADTDLGIVGARGNLPVRCIERKTLRDVILYDPEHDRTIYWTAPERETVLQATEPY